MSLFKFGKKKEEKQAVTSCCCCSGTGNNTDEDNCRSNVNAGEIIAVKVLGAGCKACHEQYENVKQAVKEMGLSVETEYITDMEKVMEYGVMSMPAIVVNEKVASMGKVLKAGEVVSLLKKHGA